MPCPRCKIGPTGIGGAFFPLVGLAGARPRDLLLPLVTFEPLEGNDPELDRWEPPKICGGCGVVFCERKRTIPPPPPPPATER
jgi:hypothetical protein